MRMYDEVEDFGQTQTTCKHLTTSLRAGSMITQQKDEPKGATHYDIATIFFRTLLFSNMFAILLVFHTRGAVVKLTRLVEKVVSVPLSVCLLLLFALQEVLLTQKRRTRQHIIPPELLSTNHEQHDISYLEIDRLFWGDSPGMSVLAGNDLQSVTLRREPLSILSPSKESGSPSEPDLQGNTSLSIHNIQSDGIPLFKEAKHFPTKKTTTLLAVFAQRKELLKTSWRILKESREYTRASSHPESLHEEPENIPFDKGESYSKEHTWPHQTTTSNVELVSVSKD